MISRNFVAIGVEISLEDDGKGDESEKVTEAITDSIHHPTKTAGVGHMTCGVGVTSLTEDTSIKTINIITDLCIIIHKDNYENAQLDSHFTLKRKTPNCLYLSSSLTKNLAATAATKTPMRDIALGDM